MPRVGKKLKILDIADPSNEVVEEKPIENITDVQELNIIEEEIENNEKKENKIEERREEKIEEKIEEIIEENIADIPKPNKKKANEEHMREYRTIKQEEQNKLTEDLKRKSKNIEKIAENQIGKQPNN